MKRGYALLLGAGLLGLGGVWWYGLGQFLTIVKRDDVVMSAFGWTGMLNYFAALMVLLVAGMTSAWYAIREE